MPARSLLQTRLTPRTAPMLFDASGCLFDLLVECDVDPTAALGAPDAEALLTQHHTLQALLDAQLVPQASLDAALAELSPGSRLAPADLVDRFLVPPVLLGLARLPAARVPSQPPPHGDWLLDVLAALIAADAYRPLLVPSLAPDAIVAGPGCHTDPRLAPLVTAGRLLAGRVGFEALVEAVARQVPWQDAFDSRTEDLVAIAHGLAIGEPKAQGRLLEWDARRLGEQDVAWLEDALYGLCVRRVRQDGLPRALLCVPAGGGLQILPQAHHLRPLAAPTADQGLDPLLHRLDLPQALCGGLLRAGWSQVRIELDDAEGLDDLVDLLVDLREQEAAPQPIVGAGFRISPEGSAA